MQGLSDPQRVHNFNIGVFAIRSDFGVIACIAGHCGLDPWFQERGFFTTVGADLGSISMAPEDFFGTDKPFFSYGAKRLVTFDDALRALDSAIASFACDTNEVST